MLLAEVRLAIPGDANSPEFQALPGELNALMPQFKFVVLAAKDDAHAVDMVLKDEADIAEADAAGVIGKYGFRDYSFGHCYGSGSCGVGRGLGLCK